MFRPAVVACVAAAAFAHAQPLALPPTYSAFPDLKGPPPIRPADLEALYARLRAAAARPIPPDAAPAAKVRGFQLKAGAEFLVRAHVRWRTPLCEMPSAAATLTRTTNDVYAAAREGEADPAARAALAEEQVRVLKEIERHVEARVVAGTDADTDLHFVRFHRLRAEGELLKVTARE